MIVSPASEREGFARYHPLADEEVEPTRQPLEGLPDTDGTESPLCRDAREAAGNDASAGGTGDRRAWPSPAAAPCRAQADAAGDCLWTDDRRQAAVLRPLLGEGENATFDVVVAAPDGTSSRRAACATSCSRSRPGTNGTAATGLGLRAGQGDEAHCGRQTDVAADKPARISLPVQWGRYRLEVSSSDRNGPVTSVGFDAGWYAEASADTPDLLEIAPTSRNTCRARA
jgi:hypothetical protein